MVHELRHGRRGNGDAKPVHDHVVDPNEPTLRIDERTAGISWREPNIRDYEFWFAAPMPNHRVQHAHRERVTNAEGMTVCEEQLAGLELVRITDLE